MAPEYPTVAGCWLPATNNYANTLVGVMASKFFCHTALGECRLGKGIAAAAGGGMICGTFAVVALKAA